MFYHKATEQNDGSIVYGDLRLFHYIEGFGKNRGHRKYNLEILKDDNYDLNKCQESGTYNSLSDLKLNIQIKADVDGDLTTTRYREFLNFELFDDLHDSGPDPRVNILGHILVI